MTAADEIHLHFASAVAGSYGVSTFLGTLMGIERGGALLADEVAESGRPG